MGLKENLEFQFYFMQHTQPALEQTLKADDHDLKKSIVLDWTFYFKKWGLTT